MTPSGMTISFPQELIDEIVDYLSEDYDSLKACSLLSPPWVFRTRIYLFETISLNPDNILIFRDFLRYTCTFLPHVRRIKVSRDSSHENDHWFDEIAAHLHRLSAVRVLEMRLIVGADNFDSVCRTGFVTAFPKVTRLVLNCNFVTAGDERPPFGEMICLFFALQELHIVGSKLRTLGRLNTDVVPPPGLRSLEFGRCTPGPILAWLNATGHLPNVKSITMSSILNTQVVRAALQQVGRSLDHLDITLDGDKFNFVGSTVFNWSLHPHLKTLAIRVHDYSSWWFMRRHQQIVLWIRRLKAPALESLTLDLDKVHYQNLEWPSLDVFLSSAAFPLLRCVVLEQHGSESEEFLPPALPLLRAAGVLHLRVNGQIELCDPL
ncbi:hypothetical protein K438DRAFT_1832310 [Mycena galopus ATCC 62051]|nr:hypothetical protein K438DRAFT_1832310 [Mycena galopus ATCC 62051]